MDDIRIEITELAYDDRGTKVTFACENAATGFYVACSIDVPRHPQDIGYGQLALHAHEKLVEEMQQVMSELRRMVLNWK